MFSCGSENEKNRLNMVGGSIPSNDHPAQWSAVGLVDRVSRKVFCSATLISKNLVVTSSHCLVRKKSANIELMFGKSVSDPDITFLQATDFLRYKNFQKYGPNFDIAWLRFKGEVPPNFKPIEILNSPAKLIPGAELSIAGYGKKATNCAFLDEDCKGGDLLTVRTRIRSYINENRLRHLIVIGPQANNGPCFGDSGGPAYFRTNKRWYLAGNFMGWDKVLVPEHLPSICDTGEAIYNYTGQYVSWIEETSGVTLSYNKNLNPKPALPNLPPQVKEPESFEQWCAYQDESDPAWYTTQRLIRIAAEKRLEIEPSFDSFLAFTNCKVASATLRWYIDSEKHIKISGFDPSKDVDYSRLEDLRPFKSLQDWGLEALTLHDHDIKDLSPLNSLRSLKKLDLSGIKKATYQPTADAPSEAFDISLLTELEELYLSRIEAEIIFDQMPQLQKLHTVDIRGGLFKKLDHLKGLPLQSLRLENLNYLSDGYLPKLDELKYLRLENLPLNQLDIDSPRLQRLQLKSLPELKSLAVSENAPIEQLIIHKTGIKSLGPISGFLDLIEISVVENENLTTMGSISDLPKLNRLEIINNDISVIRSIYNVPNLQTVIFSGNRLKTLIFPEHLYSVIELILSKNNIADLSFLTFLPNLKRIDLGSNPMKNLRGIENLKYLESISIQNRKSEGLDSLKGLHNLPSLREINLKGNSITSVSQLAKFPTLEVIILSYNFIKDITQLKDLSKLKYLDLINNAFTQKICPFEEKSICRFEAQKIPI